MLLTMRRKEVALSLYFFRFQPKIPLELVSKLIRDV